MCCVLAGTFESQVTVRDPVSGGPVADAQVRLSNGDMTVTGPDGVSFFDALPIGTYTVYAFYAPSGQSGAWKVIICS